MPIATAVATNLANMLCTQGLCGEQGCGTGKSRSEDFVSNSEVQIKPLRSASEMAKEQEKKKIERVLLKQMDRFNVRACVHVCVCMLRSLWLCPNSL